MSITSLTSAIVNSRSISTIAFASIYDWQIGRMGNEPLMLYADISYQTFQTDMKVVSMSSKMQHPNALSLRVF